ncbi:UNVERIFIED_CONTAM: hypothetical protein HDU68_010792 [Siphonaria sp. JEL0065]|nr:hypothetical protein HDU68_010792 [Siphonaria sp. JEL0065]
MYFFVSSAFVLLARVSAQSYDLALGAHVSASSTYNSGPCSLFACGPHQVVNNIPNSFVDVGQWISNPSQCDSDWRSAGTGDIQPEGRLNASLTIDWSTNYANAWGVQLIIYSQLPLNTAPIAVPMHDNADWYVFTFEEPVTASGIQLVWYGLQSRDGGQNCFVSIGNVEAWTGPPPNPIINTGGSRKGISVGALVSMIVFPILAILLCLGLGVWVLRKRRHNLAQRFATANENLGLGTLHDIATRRRQQRNEQREQKLVDNEEDDVVDVAEVGIHVDTEAVGVWNTAK